MWFRRRTAQAALLAATTLLSSCSLALDFDKTASEPRSETGFCQGHVVPPAVFCDDFDVDAFGVKWPAVEQTNGTAKDDPMAFLSSPNSLLAVANPVPVGGSVRSVGSISFPALKSTKVGFRISFDIRVDQFDSTSGAKNIVFDFLYGPPNDFNQIVMNLVSTESAVSMQVAENAQKVGAASSDYAQHGPFTTKPAIGQWMKVAIDLDISNPTGVGNALRVRLNDQTALDTQLQIALKGDTPRMELGVGWIDSSKPTQTWAVRYDDFLVETNAL